MRILSFIVAGLLACAGSIGVYAQNTLLNPFATVTSVTTTAVQIIGANASRRDIRICNVGTGIVWIWPGALSPAVSAYELPALSTGTTVCFTPPDGTVGSGNSGQGASWNAQAVSTTGPVSVIEWD